MKKNGMMNRFASASLHSSGRQRTERVSLCRVQEFARKNDMINRLAKSDFCCDGNECSCVHRSGQ